MRFLLVIPLLLVLCCLPAVAAPHDAAVPGPVSAPPPASDKVLTIAPTAHGWTIHAVNVEAHELLITFAAQAKLPLIVDDTVRRKITINLIDKTADQVLNTIVDAYGLSYGVVDGVNIISEGMPRSPSSYLLSDIASVTTKYVAPAQAQQLLPVFLQSDVKLNTDQNAVVLSGPKSLLEKFRTDVAQFDKPAAQIMLDVDVVEFSHENTDDFATLLGYGNANFGVSTNSLTGQMTLTAIGRLPANFAASLNGLVAQDRAHIRANPHIATLSGQSASIFIGQQQYLTTPVTLPGQAASNSINAGVSLTVTPLTGGGGEIILNISEEVSTLSAPDPVTGLPTKTTRTAYTTVRVRDGQTIVTGGLQQAETRVVRTAIPILSDLPLLGPLFRSKSIDKTNVDLAIFITARLLSPTGHLPAAEEQSQIQRAQEPAARGGK